jgi:hypothetical protein
VWKSFHTFKHVARFLATSDKSTARNLAILSESIERLRGNLTSSKGLGHEIIERFLQGVPGLTTYTIQQQLATLKASGDYQRIITAEPYRYLYRDHLRVFPLR